MSTFNNIRTALRQRALYVRTKRELDALPADLAREDLGLTPYDTRSIARQAVYG